MVGAEEFEEETGFEVDKVASGGKDEEGEEAIVRARIGDGGARRRQERPAEGVEEEGRGEGAESDGDEEGVAAPALGGGRGRDDDDEGDAVDGEKDDVDDGDHVADAEEEGCQKVEEKLWEKRQREKLKKEKWLRT